jgi:hypothetical protein
MEALNQGAEIAPQFENFQASLLMTESNRHSGRCSP